jgi:DNA-binding NarL/FixJ family response regulator
VTRPRVLIAEDHRVVADGLVLLLGERYEIVATVRDGSDVLDAARRLHPDVILLDVSMPHVSGLESMRQLREHDVQSRVIVLTMHADPELAVEALRAGASGFVLKESSGEELMMALDAVLGGSTYLAADLTKEILTLMVGPADLNMPQLTTRQQEILRLIVRGQRAKEIAGTLNVSSRSVEAAKYKMMQQLRVHSTAELVRYAIEHRLVAF